MSDPEGDRPARTPLEALARPYAFTQQPLLTSDDFVKAAKERGLHLDEARLEALHRARLLTPFLRVRRDGRAIAALARRDTPSAWQEAHFHTTRPQDLLEIAKEGRVTEPPSERFVGRKSLDRRAGDVEYRSSYFLYSHYQLLVLPTLRGALPHLRTKGGPRPRAWFDAHSFFAQMWRGRAQQLEALAVPLAALEPLYLRVVIGTLRLDSIEEFDRYDRWRRRQKLTEVARWLGIEARWLRETSSALLGIADHFDPLGDWLDVVRRAHPSMWQRLRGEGRSAIDFRIAAELLLHYYEDLAKGRRAPPLPPDGGRWRGEFAGRLRVRGPKHPALTRFGLSPHPRLILVLEGATELHIFPRLLAKFQIRTDDEYISVQDAEGVDRDLSTLVAFAVAPSTCAEEHGRYLELDRPLTRILVVADAEGKMRTAESRYERRRGWVDRLERTLPQEHRTKRVREALERLVYVETWTRRGTSFEFAHFTDRQLACAIASIDRRPRQQSLEDRTATVRTIRGKGGNLEKAMTGVSKVDLAGALWPVLEHKIDNALNRRTERRIPIVRVLDSATEIAGGAAERNVVLPLGP